MIIMMICGKYCHGHDRWGRTWLVTLGDPVTNRHGVAGRPNVGTLALAKPGPVTAARSDCQSLPDCCLSLSSALTGLRGLVSES
jgi:hypothetical protein